MAIDLTRYPNGRPRCLRKPGTAAATAPVATTAPVAVASKAFDLGEGGEMVMDAARRRYAMYARLYGRREFDAGLFARCLVRVAEEIKDPALVQRENNRRRLRTRDSGRLYEAFAR
ncbi:hypothetical protein [Methylosinus sp. PW1]|uniref:hypothetical protein n=1 Tax=Methylosinus sp. PW1 TaxID=107636 RepID=UPI0005672BC6|nr:hypothetical protein [Methylosinus sp. PW1]